MKGSRFHYSPSHTNPVSVLKGLTLSLFPPIYLVGTDTPMGFISNAYNDLAGERIAPAAASKRSRSSARWEEADRRRRRQSRDEKVSSGEAAVDTFESTQETTSDE